MAFLQKPHVSPHAPGRGLPLKEDIAGSARAKFLYCWMQICKWVAFFFDKMRPYCDLYFIFLMR